MRVRALMFASLRDIAGARSLEIELAEASTVDDLSRLLAERHPGLGERLGRVRVAVNEAFAEPSRTLVDGDEVAYLPPVSGGAPPQVAVVDDPIDVAEVLRSVQRPDCGAVVLFLGTVRDNFQGLAVRGMEYEAHRAMAEHGLAEVAEAARSAWPLGAVSVVHRLGRLDLNEVSVAVATSAPHRPAAFEAARFIIDRLKETVPIWKRELLEGGEVWIEGTERIPRRPAQEGLSDSARRC